MKSVYSVLAIGFMFYIFNSNVSAYAGDGGKQDCRTYSDRDGDYITCSSPPICTDRANEYGDSGCLYYSRIVDSMFEAESDLKKVLQVLGMNRLQVTSQSVRVAENKWQVRVDIAEMAIYQHIRMSRDGTLAGARLQMEEMLANMKTDGLIILSSAAYIDTYYGGGPVFEINYLMGPRGSNNPRRYHFPEAYRANLDMEMDRVLTLLESSGVQIESARTIGQGLTFFIDMINATVGELTLYFSSEGDECVSEPILPPGAIVIHRAKHASVDQDTGEVYGGHDHIIFVVRM